MSHFTSAVKNMFWKSDEEMEQEKMEKEKKIAEKAENKKPSIIAKAGQSIDKIIKNEKQKRAEKKEQQKEVDKTFKAAYQKEKLKQAEVLAKKLAEKETKAKLEEKKGVNVFGQDIGFNAGNMAVNQPINFGGGFGFGSEPKNKTRKNPNKRVESIFDL